MVVTCDEKTLPSLLRSKAFAQYHVGEGQATPEHVVTAVVHRIPQSVRSNEAYKAWMARFGPSTQVRIFEWSDQVKPLILCSI